ncbi:MAG: copper chaperone PCu(A)C [Pseudomonadota bacterium]
MIHRMLIALALSLAAAASTAQPAAPVTVDGAWARATVQGQKGTGAFMALTAREPLSLVGASSPAAGVAEVHEMKMEGDIMRMRAVDSIALPAGKTVQLNAGGYHVMLMELKAPLKPGTTVPVSLLFKTARGEPRKLDLAVPVAVTAPQAHKH